MRGYISFLLVFASVAIILAVLSATTRTSINHAKEIELQRMYYLEIDIKDTLLGLAKQGANRGAKEYIAEQVEKAAITETPLDINIPELKKRAQKAAFEDIQKMAAFEFNEPYDVKMWCGSPTFNEINKEFAQKMVEEKRALICNDCHDVTNELCEEFIWIETPTIDFKNPLNSIVDLKLFKSSSKLAVFGVSIYSKERASISYIPKGVKR